MITVRLSEDTAVPVDLPPRARRAIREEASFRGLSPERLVERLLVAIADGDRFGEILDGDWHG